MSIFRGSLLTDSQRCWCRSRASLGKRTQESEEVVPVVPAACRTRIPVLRCRRIRRRASTRRHTAAFVQRNSALRREGGGPRGLPVRGAAYNSLRDSILLEGRLCPLEPR